jgi:hypothetical protein
MQAAGRRGVEPVPARKAMVLEVSRDDQFRHLSK